jgi:hypothetical protein
MPTVNNGGLFVGGLGATRRHDATFVASSLPYARLA